MSDVRITMTVEVPVLDYGDGNAADVEEIAVQLVRYTGTGLEPVYTEIGAQNVHARFMEVSFSSEPDKLLLMMSRLAALWARWDDADGRLLPAVP